MFRIFIIFALSLTGLAAIGAKQIIALEYATGMVSQTYGASAVSDDQTLTQYGFKLGAKENEYRLFISYRYQEINSDTGYHVGMEFDNIYEFGPIGFYIGVIGGYSWYDFTGEDATVASATLPYYGGNSGVSLTLGSIELDVGARYAYYLDGTAATASAQVYTVNNMLTYYVGLNYLY